jgi:hypothetical protein
MKSFQLEPSSRGDLFSLAIAVVITAAVFAVLSYWDAVSVGIRVGALLMAAVLVSQLCTGGVRHSLELQYPNARLIGLLTAAYAVMGVGAVGQFMFEWLTPQRVFYFFMLPGGVAILAFLVVNRRDRGGVE